MPLECGLNQSERRIAFLVIAQQMDLGQRQLKALLRMRDRILIEERKRRGAVGLQQNGRRARPGRDRDRGILKLLVAGERCRVIRVARRDVSHGQDHPFGRRAVRRKIGKTPLRLGKIAVLERQERQALINLIRRRARSAQTFELLTSLLQPVKLDQNLRKLEGVTGRIRRHDFVRGRDRLGRVGLDNVHTREHPLRGHEVRIVGERRVRITRRALGVVGFERELRQERKGHRGCLGLDRRAQGGKHHRCFGLLEERRRKGRDASVGIGAGGLHHGCHRRARLRDLVELQCDCSVTRRRVGILGRKCPPALHRLPGRRQVLAGEAHFAGPPGDCDPAVHRRRRVILGGELAVAVLEREFREQRERRRIAAFPVRGGRRGRRRAAGRREEGYRRQDTRCTHPMPIHATHYKVSHRLAHRTNRSPHSMKDSIRQRIERMADRFEEVGRLLAAPETAGRSQQFRELSMEYARLQPLAEGYGRYRELERELASAQGMLSDSDESIRSLAAEEVSYAQQGLEAAEPPLLNMLITPDPRDEHNIFLEVRAGTGGDEAALFAGDLLRMYARYAESRGFTVEIVSESPGEHGGYKEIISRIAGRGAFARFKFESGTHRVQRVPATEAQGRIHTSACTVAILPELEEVEAIDINPADLRIDTYRASGAGGQHVNKTDSAVRITHVPSGIVVECQDERSQHKNRSRAMALLKARLLAAEQAKQDNARAQSRKLQVGSGDRSERIRTYNFPQGRVTDHRINLTLYKLADIMNGQLDELLDALQREHQAEELAAEE